MDKRRYNMIKERLEKGFSQSEIAKVLGVTRQAISLYRKVYNMGAFPEKRCITCGKKYIPSKPSMLYCCARCRLDKINSRRAKWKGRKKTRICIMCGKEFLCCNKQQKFCSKKCRMANKVAGTNNVAFEITLDRFEGYIRELQIGDNDGHVIKVFKENSRTNNCIFCKKIKYTNPDDCVNCILHKMLKVPCFLYPLYLDIVVTLTRNPNDAGSGLPMIERFRKAKRKLQELYRQYKANPYKYV